MACTGLLTLGGQSKFRRLEYLAGSSVNQYGCAYRFLHGKVLGLGKRVLQIPLAPAHRRASEILSHEAPARLFTAACREKSRAPHPVGVVHGSRAVSEVSERSIAWSQAATSLAGGQINRLD